MAAVYVLPFYNASVISKSSRSDNCATPSLVATAILYRALTRSALVEILDRNRPHGRSLIARKAYVGQLNQQLRQIIAVEYLERT